LLGKDNTVTEADKPGIKTLMDIGRGYDVFDRYGSGLSLKQAVLDTDKLVEKGQIQRSAATDYGDFREIEGESLEEYSKEMTANAKVKGSYLGFKASVETSFSSSYRSKATSYYNTINYLVLNDNLFIKSTCNYKDYVLPDVKAILDTGKYNGKTWSATEIFDAFGGYVLVDGMFGGRLEFNATADSYSCSTYSNFKANVQASYNAIAGSVSGEFDYGTVENREQFLSNSSITVITYGGLAQDGKSLSAAQQGASALQAWRDSIPNRSVLVEFGKTGSTALLPIWELCSESARANALKAAFDTYASGRQTVLPQPQKYLYDLCFVTSNISKEVALGLIPDGFTSTYVDLNAGAGGNWIYLTYKLRDWQPAAYYTDMFMELSSDKSAPSVVEKKNHNGITANYWRMGADLNRNCKKGSSIYLWVSRDANKLPIRQIEIVDKGKDSTPPQDIDGWTYVKWQNTNEPADCNKTASGNYIYIRYR
jgi:hypothetical protein